MHYYRCCCFVWIFHVSWVLAVTVCNASLQFRCGHTTRFRFDLRTDSVSTSVGTISHFGKISLVSTGSETNSVRTQPLWIFFRTSYTDVKTWLRGKSVQVQRASVTSLCYTYLQKPLCSQVLKLERSTATLNAASASTRAATECCPDIMDACTSSCRSEIDPIPH